MDLLKLPSDQKLKKEYKLCVLGEGGVGKSCLVIDQLIFEELFSPFLGITICSRSF